MKIQEKMHIKVFNYTDAKICVESRNRGYTFEPASDGIPSLEIMSFDEIEYINSKGEIFRSGALRFEEDKEEEIFEALKYPQWRNTLFSEEDIEDIIFHPSVENQKRLIAVKNTGTMERIRSKLVRYNNMEKEGVSHKITNLINDRFDELRRGVYKSQLVVGEIKSQNTVVEVENIKKQNKELKSELEEVKKLMAELLATKEKLQSDEDKPESKNEPEQKKEPAKKAGRPKKRDSKEG